ncbi:hypothetical protein N7462_001149 [Penicillium macrosclerotiorum]|uniref:uncharacterized protein n=1 Tax=Penicillium macrosclerotiorum TaxID=303699 RepID=UPI002548A027|nr:uncharacterized protein N7462_001149 [Penicillium macrosclerotiorum]KAJ5699144.1 hypothetical protein N7462_001149 [Penicillium macrosclerotiorum]
MEVIEVDALICGGGMSGMACAAFAAEAGAKTLVVEKQKTIGGSSNFSAGMFWAPHSFEKLRSWVPEGDPCLQRAWLDEYLPAVQWMRENGIPTSSRYDGIMTIGIFKPTLVNVLFRTHQVNSVAGIGFPIKIPSLHKVHRQRIESSNTGSKILENATILKLIQERENVPGSRIIGAIIRAEGLDGSLVYHEVRAKVVVLATGGFQGSSRMTATYLNQGADNIFVRSNPGSVGDGLRLATKVGAGASRGLNTFYGHLLAAPLRREEVDPVDFLPLAQYQSKHCILVNQAGQRFADETIGDEILNQHLAKQETRRGFLIFNEKTRLEHCMGAFFPNAGDVDRLQKAREYGCNVGEASTLNGLLNLIREWGVDYVQAARTLEQYDQFVRLGKRNLVLDAPTGQFGLSPAPLVEGEGPFYAMEVQPSITFTYGGILIDTKGRALTHDKVTIPGLLVAGVDAGGFSNTGYAGGLALAFVTGLWAAREIARELGLPEPHLPAACLEDSLPLHGRL